MKKTVILIVSLIYVVSFSTKLYSQSNTVVIIKTTVGDLKIKLYDETPMHKENFLKLISDGYYNDILFHRVINNFMIQAGDPNSKFAKPGQMLGSGDLGYTVPPEFQPELYHKKGALAAARQSDNINPQKRSSAGQFYIVQGRVYTDKELDIMEQKNAHIKFTDEQRIVYTSIGGTPHLDYAYTVFGEVIEGTHVIDEIASVSTDTNNRPLTDIKIKSISIQ
ncbi:MAG: peptidylprolyl isomerase [Bacteroidales bacterium]|nr:peptidylprolyl isomerase [Bacteroidales bacterium]